MLLTFGRTGTLEAVAVNAPRLLAAPTLVQRAVILHELEHVKWAAQTRRLLGAPAAPVTVGQASSVKASRLGSRHRAPDAARLQHIVRVLVDDEARAYARDIRYVEGIVSAHGGLAAYLATLPRSQRLPVSQYYQRSIQPFVDQAGHLNERRLRRDFIFLKTFPRHFPRHYEAALMWEALQGHVELRRGHDGIWRPGPLIEPAAFLAWLAP